MHGKILPEVTKLNAGVAFQWIGEQILEIKRGKGAHFCRGAACAATV